MTGSKPRGPGTRCRKMGIRANIPGPSKKQRKISWHTLWQEQTSCLILMWALQVLYTDISVSVVYTGVFNFLACVCDFKEFFHTHLVLSVIPKSHLIFPM